jgi:ubiquinone/menaquinone biosynthesis C-methylase UbiE
MPDLYTTITEVDDATQGALADAMISRAADPAMQEIRASYIDALDAPRHAALAEIGCGPGDVLHAIADQTGARRAIGVDPSPVMIARARERHADATALEFVEGEAEALPFGEDSLDAAVFHTCLCHLANPDLALGEVRRVLRPGGRLAVFDGDYATATAAVSDGDPVHGAVAYAIANLVHDRWLMRSIAPRLAAAGFAVERCDGHAYLPASPDYFLTLVQRGASFMVRDGLLTQEAADALCAAARDRADAGRFYGFIGFMSAIATRRETST